MNALATICRRTLHVALPVFAIVFGVSGALLPWREVFTTGHDRALLHVPVVRVFGGDGNTVAMSTSPDSQLETVVKTHPGMRPISFSPSTTAGQSSEAVLQSSTGAHLSIFVNPHLGGNVGERSETVPAVTWLRALHTGAHAGAVAEILVALLMLAVLELLVRESVSRRARYVNRIIAACALAYLASALMAAPLTGRTIHRLLTSLHIGWPDEADASAHRSTPTIWKHPADPPADTTTPAPAPRKIVAMQHDETGAMVSENVINDPAPPPAPNAEAPARRGPPDPATLEWCGAVRGTMDVQLPPISLARVVHIATEQNFPAPYAITLPATETSVFTLSASSDNPGGRALLHLDQYEGTVLADVRYGEVPAPGRFATWLAAVHDGTAFGTANRIVVSIASLALIVAALTPSYRRWREREPADRDQG